MTRGRILIVDDSESTRYIVATWLRRGGYETVEAATGREGLARLAGADLVILDVRLPDITGHEVCAAIKADPSTAAIPVLHISATALDVADRAAGLNAGADGYLTEPVEPEILLATVRAMLRYSGGRRQAERLADRLGRLTQASLAINAARSRSELLSVATAGASAVFEGPAAMVEFTEDGDLSVVSARAGASSWPLTPVTPLTGKPDWTRVGPPAEGVVGDGDTLDAWRSILGATVEAVLVLPADSRNSPGPMVLAVALEADTRFRVGDLLLGRQLAQSVSLAMDNLRLLTEEQRIAMTLQRSLLPAHLPDLPGLKLAARYSASSEHALVGGDFFDAISLPGGAVVVAIGDVQGHSLAAATIMAELRYSLRAYVLEGHTPAETLCRLDRLLSQGHPDETATVCLVMLSPDRRSMQVTNAGHLPPLLFQGGKTQFFETPGVLLGFGAPSQSVEVALDDDAIVVLVTDGLIERRGVDLDNSLERLALVVCQVTACSEAAVEPADLCDHLMNHFSENENGATNAADDDMAVVVLARSPMSL